MKKLTRKHYNRKLLIGGLTAFASIALISTGFASYVLSTNANKKIDGNITIGKVTEAALIIDPVTLSAPNFLFEPLESDTSGRVRNDGENFECMSIIIKGEIQNAQYLKDLTIKLNLSDTFNKAIEANFIEAPLCAKEPVKLVSTPDDENKPNVKDFSYTIEFKWGNVFGGVNPGIYYDDTEPGKQVDDNLMKATIENFRKVAYGIDNPNDEVSNGSNKFEIVLEATAN